MGAKAFEIGLFDPNAARGAMLPRLWDLDTLIRSVSWLRLKNAQGRNIYIRPAGEHSLSLIHDASIQVIERLKVEGFAPAVVLETSPGNFQAWLHHGRILPKHMSTFAAWLLASRFGGDLASADGGTTEDSRALPIAKTNMERPMEPFRMCGCMRPQALSI
jgi:hypothetical protein